MLLSSAIISLITAAPPLDVFLSDIIEEWQLHLPTIVGGEDLPAFCMMHKRVLCLTNNRGIDELGAHVALLHLNGGQDGVVFLGTGEQQQLEQKVTKLAPTFWRSNCPVFMPLGYLNEIRLRLDSNIIFYK